MKKLMKKSSVSIVVVLLAGLLSGCVSRAITQNEPRQAVHFASAQSAQTFYDAYLAHHYPSNYGGNTNCISVMIPLPYRQYHERTENVRFNAAIKKADADHDGLISDYEAAAYAESVRRPQKK